MLTVKNVVQLCLLLIIIELGTCQTVVKAKSGYFAGSVQDGVVSFLGIRYGIAERFKPPKMYEYPNSSEPYNATQFRHQCYQDEFRPLDKSMSEDCLFLNIWVPESAIQGGKANASKLPVLIYIHGGALCTGSGATSLLNVTTYTDKGIIVVSLNYRLGIFGFWMHPELTARQPDFPTNFGLLDQQLAIKWIQKNIEYFGGDPNEITLLGESAGAMSILQHLCSSQQRKERYFKRGVLHSMVLHEHPTDLNSSYAAGAHWAAQVGCNTPGQVLECMERKSPHALLRSALFRWSPVASPRLQLNLVFPVDDGVNFCSPIKALSSGNFDASVELIIGGSRDESTLFALMAFPVVGPSNEMYQHFAELGFPRHKDAVLQLYKPEAFKSPFNALCAVLTDVRFLCPLRRGSRWLVRHNAKSVRRYLFSHKPRHSLDRLGVYHTAEMPFVWKSAPGEFVWPDKLDDDEWMLADNISGLIADFVRGTLTEEKWPAWSETEEPVMIFGDEDSTEIKIVNELRYDQCNFWDSAYPQGPTLSDVELSAREELLYYAVNEGVMWYINNRGLVHFLLSAGLVIIAIVILCTKKRKIKAE